jgi:L-asparagine transporter-like permease
MDKNPYRAPEHYASRSKNSVPWTAYVGAAVFMLCGAALSAFGLYNIWIQTALAGFFWFGVGTTIAWCIISYSRRSD